MSTHPLQAFYNAFYAGKDILSDLSGFSAADIATAEFAAARLSEKWETWNYGVEAEFCGLTFQQAAELIAKTAPKPTSIAWPHGRRGASPGYHSNHTKISDGVAGRGEWAIASDISVCTFPGARDPQGRSVGRTDKVEMVTGHPSYWQRDAADLAKIIAAFRAAGGITTQRCGGHVHVDARPFMSTGTDRFGDRSSTPDVQKINCLVQLLGRNEDLLMYAIGLHPYRGKEWSGVREVRGGYVSPGYTTTMRSAGVNFTNLFNASNWREFRNSWTGGRGGVNLSNTGNYRKNTIEFRYFNGTLDPDRLLAHLQLALALVIFAAECQRPVPAGTPTKVDPVSAAYDWRVFMLSLGMTGKDFARTRALLTQNLPGNKALKDARGTNRTIHPAGYDPNIRPRVSDESPGPQPGATGETVDLTQVWGSAPSAAPRAADLKQTGNWAAAPTAGNPQAKPSIWYYRLPDKNGAPRWYTIQAVAGADGKLRYMPSYQRFGSGVSRVFWITHDGAGEEGRETSIPWDSIGRPKLKDAVKDVAAHYEAHPRIGGRAGSRAAPATPTRSPAQAPPAATADPATAPPDAVVSNHNTTMRRTINVPGTVRNGGLIVQGTPTQIYNRLSRVGNWPTTVRPAGSSTPQATVYALRPEIREAAFPFNHYRFTLEQQGDNGYQVHVTQYSGQPSAFPRATDPSVHARAQAQGYLRNGVPTLLPAGRAETYRTAAAAVQAAADWYYQDAVTGPARMSMPRGIQTAWSTASSSVAPERAGIATPPAPAAPVTAPLDTEHRETVENDAATMREGHTYRIQYIGARGPGEVVFTVEDAEPLLIMGTSADNLPVVMSMANGEAWRIRKGLDDLGEIVTIIYVRSAAPAASTPSSTTGPIWAQAEWPTSRGTQRLLTTIARREGVPSRAYRLKGGNNGMIAVYEDIVKDASGTLSGRFIGWLTLAGNLTMDRAEAFRGPKETRKRRAADNATANGYRLYAPHHGLPAGMTPQAPTTTQPTLNPAATGVARPAAPQDGRLQATQDVWVGLLRSGKAGDTFRIGSRDNTTPIALTLVEDPRPNATYWKFATPRGARKFLQYDQRFGDRGARLRIGSARQSQAHDDVTFLELTARARSEGATSTEPETYPVNTVVHFVDNWPVAPRRRRKRYVVTRSPGPGRSQHTVRALTGGDSGSMSSAALSVGHPDAGDAISVIERDQNQLLDFSGANRHKRIMDYLGDMIRGGNIELIPSEVLRMFDYRVARDASGRISFGPAGSERAGLFLDVEAAATPRPSASSAAGALAPSNWASTSGRLQVVHDGVTFMFAPSSGGLIAVENGVQTHFWAANADRTSWNAGAGIPLMGGIGNVAASVEEASRVAVAWLAAGKPRTGTFPVQSGAGVSGFAGYRNPFAGRLRFRLGAK